MSCLYFAKAVTREGSAPIAPALLCLARVRHGFAVAAIALLALIAIFEPVPTRAAGIGSSPAERDAGDAFAREGDRLLYREVHWRYVQDGVAKRLVIYQCPDGAAFARKLLTESASPTAPDYEFVDGRDGYREGVRTRGNTREVFVRERAGSPERTMPLEIPEKAVIDAGFDAMVRSEWGRLSSPESISLPFLVPSQFAFVDVKIAEIAADRVEGEQVRRLRMSVDRWYGFAAPSIEVDYSTADRRLLEFTGLGTVRDSEGRRQDVRIVFPADQRARDIPIKEVEAAAAFPLVRQCTGPA